MGVLWSFGRVGVRVWPGKSSVLLASMCCASGHSLCYIRGDVGWRSCSQGWLEGEGVQGARLASRAPERVSIAQSVSAEEMWGGD